MLFIDTVWGVEVGSTVLKGGTKRRFEYTKVIARLAHLGNKKREGV